jgi:hypothetical protein
MFLFAAGAAAAYGLLKVASHSAANFERDIGASPHVFRAGVLHVGGICLGIGAAALVARIGTGIAWPLATFASTTLYLAVTGVEIALMGG